MPGIPPITLTETVFYSDDHEARRSAHGGFDLYCGGQMVFSFIPNARAKLLTVCRKCMRQIMLVAPDPDEDAPPGDGVPDREFGTDPHKLHRAADPDTSRKAAHSIETTKLEQLVFDAIEASGVRGLIADDLLSRFSDRAYSSLTARPSALIDKGLVFRLKGTRQGKSNRPQHVLVTRSNLAGREVVTRDG